MLIYPTIALAHSVLLLERDQAVNCLFSFQTHALPLALRLSFEVLDVEVDRRLVPLLSERCFACRGLDDWSNGTHLENPPFDSGTASLFGDRAQLSEKPLAETLRSVLRLDI